MRVPEWMKCGSPGRARRTRARLPLALLALACALAPQAGLASGLLGTSLGAGHGVALTPSARAAAAALARGIAALEAGELSRADAELAKASAAGILPEYVALFSARLQLARGQQRAAADTAASVRAAYPQTTLLTELWQLEGDALAAAGDEEVAREAWSAALARSSDLEQRRLLKLAIVQSRQRSGELEPAADPEQLLARVFADTALPSELPPGQRSAQAALATADSLVADGRGAEAVLAYREALDGELGADERRRARHRLGLALFHLRRYDEAIPSFAALAPDPEALHWHARANARVGRIEQALREFETLVKTAPPEISSRSAFRAATLYEDRGEREAAMRLYGLAADYTQFPGRAAEAAWRIGWSEFRRAKYEEARRRFLQMGEMGLHQQDPLLGLRPRYWAARAAARLGLDQRSRSELREIASGYPLTYYGWRAEQQLGEPAHLLVDDDAVQPANATATLPAQELERIALLLEAGLALPAQVELEPLAERARTISDRIAVGRLLAEAGNYHRAQRLVVDAYSLPLSQGLRRGDEGLWWLSWPPAYRDIVMRSLPRDAQIEPALVWAVMREESGFRPEVMSSAGAMGLLQLMPETADRMAKESGFGELGQDSLFSPETNIALGSFYLEHLAGRFPGRISAAIGSYNAGPLVVARWLEGSAAKLDDDVWVEDIPYDQTQSYVKRVLLSLYVYRAFY